MSQPEEIRALHVGQSLPVAFRDADIAQKYHDGFYSCRVDAEVEDILRFCFPREGKIRSGEEDEVIYPVEAIEVLRHLNCIALLQNGAVLPLLDIAQMSIPPTGIGKSQLYLSVIRQLMAVVGAILDDHMEQQQGATDQAQQRDRPGDEDEGVPCCD